MVERGVYRFNPPYSSVAAELVRLSDGSTGYVQVDQADALAELRAAGVEKQRNGVYRINAMLAACETPADARAAIDTMDPADRLDDPHFVARHHHAVED